MIILNQYDAGKEILDTSGPAKKTNKIPNINGLTTIGALN